MIAADIIRAGVVLPVQHEVRVYSQPGPGSQSASWARCSCGWTHRGSFRTRSEAQTLADEHTQATSEEGGI